MADQNNMHILELRSCVPQHEHIWALSTLKHESVQMSTGYMNILLLWWFPIPAPSHKQSYLSLTHSAVTCITHTHIIKSPGHFFPQRGLIHISYIACKSLGQSCFDEALKVAGGRLALCLTFTVPRIQTSLPYKLYNAVSGYFFSVSFQGWNALKYHFSATWACCTNLSSHWQTSVYSLEPICQSALKCGLKCWEMENSVIRLHENRAIKFPFCCKVVPIPQALSSLCLTSRRSLCAGRIWRVRLNQNPCRTSVR